MKSNTTLPLVVDLDGTLIRTDLLHESLLLLLLKHPLRMLLLPLWLIQGRAYFKHRLSTLVTPSFESLPINENCLALLQQAAAEGRKIVLATASPSVYAEEIFSRFPVLNECIASSSERNLKGRNKAAELVARYGEAGYDYIGDSGADLAVWAMARNGIAVNPNRKTRQKFLALHPNGRIIEDTGNAKMNKYLKTLRPHQWSKNLLLFVPLLAAQKISELDAFTSLILAFTAFCMTASASYILNDLVDLENDRQHPVKRNRPLASGDVPLFHALAMAPLLLIAAAAISAALPISFLLLLVGYMAITITYSLYLKQLLLVDVFTLAGLYTLRIFAGATAIQVAVSPWLLLLSIFIFFSLALIKRYAELDQHSKIRGNALGRAYSLDDMPILLTLGISSGLMSVLVLALYIQSEQVNNLYSTPELLWGGCVVLMYWITRIWMLATHGKIHEDPIQFALRDPTSLITAAILGLLFLAAI